ncbi:hypothetical protein GGX14DRAFT_405755 [Mycena pura]|uniref:Uncharacterized protein n=1 Tax=Mycena pura TaxID=153505 RepID=A0AAD6URJ3_9AGAR|nr:hypothetical protein GGX14DRAFT_405755 [Mycena pura]
MSFLALLFLCGALFVLLWSLIAEQDEDEDDLAYDPESGGALFYCADPARTAGKGRSRTPRHWLAVPVILVERIGNPNIINANGDERARILNGTLSPPTSRGSRSTPSNLRSGSAMDVALFNYGRDEDGWFPDGNGSKADSTVLHLQLNVYDPVRIYLYRLTLAVAEFCNWKRNVTLWMCMLAWNDAHLVNQSKPQASSVMIALLADYAAKSPSSTPESRQPSSRQQPSFEIIGSASLIITLKPLVKGCLKWGLEQQESLYRVNRFLYRKSP